MVRWSLSLIVGKPESRVSCSATDSVSEFTAGQQTAILKGIALRRPRYRGAFQMDQFFQLIGLALPDTPVIFRLKVLLVGIGGAGAGMLFMTSGLAGSVLWGGAIAACGFGLIAITIQSFAGEARKRAVERMAFQRRQEEEAREQRERLVRQQFCDHAWSRDDQAFEYSVCQMCCTKCGAVRQGWS